MKWIYRFFVVLGVIFFCLLVGLGYFIIADPLNLRPVIMSMYNTDTGMEADGKTDVTGTDQSETVQTSSGTNAVNENQAKALESVGLDPQSVPTQFTPEQTTCFVRILGQDRVDAIVAGATPTPAEFYQAKDCL